MDPPTAEPADDPGLTHDWLLWVALSCYLLGLLIIACVANRRRQLAATQGSLVSAHFSGEFGTGVLALTTVATIFSGYTVSGVPLDAYQDGFLSLRWFTGLPPMVGTMLILYPRLRRLARARKYDSPNDFIADRFRSRRLRVLTCACCTASSVIYLTVQFRSFADELHDLSNQRIPPICGMVIFGLLVLVLEAAGGLTSVVYSDAAQASLMLLCFLFLPVLIFQRYGSPASFIPAGPVCESIFVDQSQAFNKFAAPGICSSARPGCIPSGCLGDVRPELLAYPERAKAMDQVLWFNFLMAAYPINFHIVQRVFVAKKDSGIKVVAGSVFVAGILAFTPGILLGLSKAANDRSWPAVSRASSPLGGSLEELMKIGPFARAVTTLMHCAYLAAIMSTSDSVIMGVSAAVSLDTFKGSLRPEASTQEVVRFGAFVSILQVGLAILCGSLIGMDNPTWLFNFQNGLLMQVAPAYFLGMFTSVCTIAVISGIVVGLGTLIALVGVASIYPMFGAAPAYMIALAGNLLVIGVVNVAAGRLFPRDDDHTGKDFFTLQDRWGPRLTTEKIESYLGRSKPPSVAFGIVMILTGLLAAPLFPMASQSALVAGALPVWAVTMLLLAALGTVTGVVAIAVWKIPAEVEENEEVRESRSTGRDPLDGSMMSSSGNRRSRESRLLSASMSSSFAPPTPLPMTLYPKNSGISLSTQATLQELGAPVL